ncbi:MAG: helix-hairpin-helix domain-containing protein, partial [Gemmataceae bacterium]|nr:helix-hairpin-helix domain-containing protein [Gemmataceae bacterium]
MASLPDDTRARLTLHLIPGLGPLRTAALLEHFGSAEAVLRAGAAELAGVPGVGAKLAADVVAGRAVAGVEEELRLMEQHRVGLAVLGAPGGLFEDRITGGIWRGRRRRVRAVIYRRTRHDG